MFFASEHCTHFVPIQTEAEIWIIDPARTVSGFAVRHMLISNITGVFEMTKGTIEYEPGDANSVKAEITIETKNVHRMTSA